MNDSKTVKRKGVIVGTIKGIWSTRQVFVEGIELNPNISQKIRNHSPDGFCWGYGGSGPAQLALALMLYFCSYQETAIRFYQYFKWDVIAELDKADFEISVDIVRDYISSRIAEINKE